MSFADVFNEDDFDPYDFLEQMNGDVDAALEQMDDYMDELLEKIDSLNAEKTRLGLEVDFDEWEWVDPPASDWPEPENCTEAFHANTDRQILRTLGPGLDAETWLVTANQIRDLHFFNEGEWI